MVALGSVTSAERRWTLGFACVVMLLTSVPYLLAYGLQGDAMQFSGFVFGVEDGNSYIAKMLSGSAGAWLFRTPYTAYPQKGTLQFIPYLLLGKLAAPPGLHEQLVALYHVFRVVAGVFAIMATYRFLAFFLSIVRYRRWGVVLAALGGGLGWVLVLVGRDNWLGSLPLEFYSPESFGFLGLFGLPHLAMARALLMWALVIYLGAVQKAENAPSMILSVLKLTVLWLLAGLMQPLVMVVIGTVFAVHLGGMAVWNYWRHKNERQTEWARWRRLAGLVLLSGILPGLLVLYNLWLLWKDPYMAGWAAQNLIRSPHPWHYLLAYGLLVPFAWVGGRWYLRQAPWTGWLLVGWVLALPLLAYAPVNLQRRLPEGIWVAWVALSMAALENPDRSVGEGERLTLRWPAAVLLLTLPSTFILFTGSLLTVLQVDQPLYRSSEEVTIFEFLQAEAEADQIVLSAYETGNALPAWAPMRVVIGHGPESVNLRLLRPQVAAFYSEVTSDEQRIDFLLRLDVSYVFWGPNERSLGDWDPYQASFLRLIAQVGEYSLFEFIPSSMKGNES